MEQIIIYLQVKTNKKKFLIENIEDNKYIIHINSIPINNKANKEIINELSKYFKVNKNQIIIIKGLKSNNKIIKII